MRWTRYFVAQTAINSDGMDDANSLDDANSELGFFRDLAVVSQLRSVFMSSVSSSSALVGELIDYDRHNNAWVIKDKNWWIDCTEVTLKIQADPSPHDGSYHPSSKLFETVGAKLIPVCSWGL
jgi:hypothetical protein